MKHFEQVMNVLALRSAARMNHYLMWLHAAADRYEDAMTYQLLYLACSSDADNAADKMSDQADDTLYNLFQIAQNGKRSTQGW